MHFPCKIACSLELGCHCQGQSSKAFYGMLNLFFLSFLGNLVEVYRCQNQLAVFFVSTGDKWLSDHYFAQCLETSEKLPEDDRSFTAEGHCNMAISQEENGMWAGGPYGANT